MFDLEIKVRVSVPKPSAKTAAILQQARQPWRFTKFQRQLMSSASAAAVAFAAHWLLNDPAPSQVFVEELIKLLLRG